MSVGLGFDLPGENKVSFFQVLESEPEELKNLREIIKQYNKLGRTEFEIKQKIEPKYIPLHPFPKDNQLDSYHSTIWFIETLTGISKKILKAQDRMSVLAEELKVVNTLLPAQVYLPFSNSVARNCAILHIPISEVKVFSTKERAPFLICLEIYRPYEELNNEEFDTNFVTRTFRSHSLPSVQGSFKANSRSHHEITNEEYHNIMKMAMQRASEKPDEIPRENSRSFEEVRSIPSYSVPNFHYDYLQQFMTAPVTHQDLAAVYGGEEDEETQEERPDTARVFKENFEQQTKRLGERSPFGQLKTWDIVRIIVKSGDDLRQEQLAMQIISFFKQTFVSKKLGLWLYAYEILATGTDCGILECVPDAMSIDGVKRILGQGNNSLYDYFLSEFGDPNSKRFKRARRNFMKSLAGYSLLCYILQIKDRHNGNILIDHKGRLIHIDFGFMLSNSPGGNMNFEKAPFKLTDEFEAILGGRRSNTFQEFRSLCVKGFSAIQARAEQIILILEMMRNGSGASLSCFIGGEESVKGVRERLFPRTRMSESDCKEYVNRLVDESLDNWTTRCYDRFQYCCQNIFY